MIDVASPLMVTLSTPLRKLVGCTATQLALLPSLRQISTFPGLGQSTNFHWMVRRLGSEPVMVLNTVGDRSSAPCVHSGHLSRICTTAVVFCTAQSASMHETSAQRPQLASPSHWSLLSAA